MEMLPVAQLTAEQLAEQYNSCCEALVLLTPGFAKDVLYARMQELYYEDRRRQQWAAFCEAAAKQAPLFEGYNEHD